MLPYPQLLQNWRFSDALLKGLSYMSHCQTSSS